MGHPTFPPREVEDALRFIIQGSAWNRLVRSVSQLVTQQLRFSASHRAGAVAVFRFQAMQDDYLECITYDSWADAEGSITIKVAKPPLLRRSVTSHGGVSFSYSSAIARTADSTEDQVIVPAYDVDDLIVAARVQRGTGLILSGPERVEWLDLNVDARGWAADTS